MDLYGHTFVLSRATLCVAMVVYFLADRYDCIKMMLDNVEYHLDDTEPWFWFLLASFFFRGPLDSLRWYRFATLIAGGTEAMSPVGWCYLHFASALPHITYHVAQDSSLLVGEREHLNHSDGRSDGDQPVVERVELSGLVPRRKPWRRFAVKPIT